MNMDELEARIKSLESQVRTLQDIEDIKKLQRAYGYYLEHWMTQEIIDLFADGPGVALEWPEGKYLGKEGVKRYFEGNDKKDPEFLHQLMQLSPVVDIEPDGKSAKGRWYCWGAIAAPVGGGVIPSFQSGLYENEYVKEDGKWKIKRFRWHMTYAVKPGEGLVDPLRIAAADRSAKIMGATTPDIPDTRFEHRYPSGYIFPFHYHHPVTAQPTSEGQRNLSVKGVKKAIR
jgi:hypothetical protein